MDEKRQAHEDMRAQDYMQEQLREFVEQHQRNQVNEDPLVEDAFTERGELVSALAKIREDHFHYGRGYDSLMDAMVQSPLAVLDAVQHVLEGVEQGEIDFYLSEADPFS